MRTSKNLLMTISMALLVGIISSISVAKESTFIKNCKSLDESIEILVETVYPIGEVAFSKATYQDVELKSVENSGPNYLRGNTTGDMDNFQTYQLILLESEEKASEAVLIIQNHIDRRGFENTIQKLTCTDRKRN